MSRVARLEGLLAADPLDADVMYMLAQEHSKAGDYTKSVEYFDRCLGQNPSYLYAYFHKARAQQAAGDESAARATLTLGVARAHAAADAKALGELTTYLQSLGG